MEKKRYVVFSQKVAGWLMLKGFVLLKIEETEKDGSRRNVFIFNETNDLKKSIHEYKLINSKNKN